MNLLALQRQVARAVMAPLSPSDRMRRVAPNGRPMSAVADQIIKRNDRLTSFERLEIYNRQYWFRVLDAFSEDFPGLRAVLGDRRFDALAKKYLTDCPSRSFTMRDLGSRLESWLRKHSRYASGRLQLALDMVRLEWAEIEAFDGAFETPVTAAFLAGADPSKLRLRFQPYIRLLDLHYPVDDLLLAIKHDASTNVASNAMQERQKRKKVSAVARLKPAPAYLAVHRVDNSVYFRRLDREEFTILSALHHGRTLERAILAGFHSSKIPMAQRAPNVAAWFQNWSSLGWFVT
ncbi:MAG: DNA-binding domain-containing protein [Candidatus Acidiferrum sp.]